MWTEWFLCTFDGYLDALFLDIPSTEISFSGFVTLLFCFSFFFSPGYYAVHPTKSAQLPT